MGTCLVDAEMKDPDGHDGPSSSNFFRNDITAKAHFRRAECNYK
jgi:hypothetical protein